MKKILLLITALFFISFTSYACDIKFLVNGIEKYDSKKIYQPNEEIKVTILMSFVHKPCPLSIEESKLKFEGLEVVSESKWIETEDGGYKKEITLKVMPNFPKDARLTMTRTCEREGGFGRLVIKHS